MTDLGYSKMHQLYEAMSVCGETVEWLKQQEREQIASDLHFHLSKVTHYLRESITALSGGDPWPEDVSKDALREGGHCMTMLGSMLGVLTSLCVREVLPALSPKSSEQIRFLLEEIEQAADRLADIVEAWAIPFDSEMSGKIETALRQLDSSKTEIGDWRTAFESLPD